MMIKRVLLYGVVLAILLMVAVSAGQWDKDTAVLQQHADEISLFCSEQELLAQNWLKAHPTPTPADFTTQSNQAYTILQHHADSLLFWSNTRVLPTPKELKSLEVNNDRQVLRLPLGWFMAVSTRNSSTTTSILVPIRYALDAQVQHPFPADASILNNITISSEKTDFAIRVGNKDLCWLDSDGTVQSSWLQWIKLLASLLFVGVLLVLIDRTTGWLNAQFGNIAGVLLPLAVVLAFIGFNLKWNITGKQFGSLPLFEPVFKDASWLGQSLGDMLCHIGLVVWLILIFHRAFQVIYISTKQPVWLQVLASTGYLVTMCSIPLSVGVFRRLAMQERINFDFNDLLNLDAYSLLAGLGVILLLLGLFLFNHRIALMLQQSGLSRVQRIRSLAGAGLAFSICCAILPDGFVLSFLIVAFFGVLYAVLLDIFVHWEQPGFGWIILWMLFFAFFTSFFLYQYNALRGQSERIAYAEALAEPRDVKGAEVLLQEVYAAMLPDSQQLNILLKPWPFKAAEATAHNYFNQFIFKKNYLFQHYRLNVFAFDKEQQPMLLGQTGNYELIVQKNWEQGKPLENAPGIRYYHDQEGKFRYMLQLSAFRMGDPTQPARVFCFFDHDYPTPTQVYAQLFYNTPYKNLYHLGQYDFAVLQNKKLVVEQGQVNFGVLETPSANGTAVMVKSTDPTRLDAVYKSADGQTVASVGRRLGGWYKQIYLFSILFTIGALFLFLLALLNAYLGFLPEYFKFKLSVGGSLARRIHFWNVSLMGGAFLVIGLMTYLHFTAVSKESERANLDYRTEAVLANLKTQLLNTTLSADSMRKTLPRTLSTMAASLSMDANLYGQNGDLLFTTQKDLAGLAILPNKMNAAAYESLRNSSQPERVEPEQVAGFKFFTKYMPLRNGQNQLLGYLGIPYQLSETKAGPEVSDFIGILASLYVFLLLIAYVVTLLLARSIIKPVRLISDKIRLLRLEDKNEPLEYDGDPEDELRILVDRYNTMVDKLEDSKVQMIRLEREGAWREMARQVAHDIKNPLTTMKLSMQQLERVSSDPEQAAAYLRKAITRLIEQIDSLAQIASEFSMFANLDIREKHDMVLNEVVENVHDLFSEQKNVDLDLTLPNERFHILGDKNHLIRVFNNLVINAIQAIPSDRRGQIRVSLYRRDKMAVVQIGDNGGGIPAEIQQRVFEPNFTTKTSGSGLGLAICKKIIEQHDGDIHFETIENQGTNFFVEMPIALTQSR